jgi:ankyrin repeat protein
MLNTINDAWQQAIRDIDTAAISKLLADEPTLVHQGIVHTRRNGTTYEVLPLEMVNKSLDAAKILVAAGADPNEAGQGDALPLHNSALDVARFLLGAGADVNKVGYEGCTLLMYEVYMKNHDTARLFIEQGANVDFQRQLDGFCSLHFAVQKRDTEMVDILLAAGVDSSVKNDDGQTPLDIAIANGTTDIINQLESDAG